MQITVEPGEMHLIPWEGQPNHYLDAVQFFAGAEHVYVFREGQTYDEFMAELAAAKVREDMGLAPGRTMPTEEEIAAGPPPPTVIIPYGEFRGRWMEDELAGLFAVRKTVWQVDDYVSLAQAQNSVNLTGLTAATAKALFVKLGVLTAERADAIFQPHR